MLSVVILNVVAPKNLASKLRNEIKNGRWSLKFHRTKSDSLQSNSMLLQTKIKFILAQETAIRVSREH